MLRTSSFVSKMLSIALVVCTDGVTWPHRHMDRFHRLISFTVVKSQQPILSHETTSLVSIVCITHFIPAKLAVDNAFTP